MTSLHPLHGGVMQCPEAMQIVRLSESESTLATPAEDIRGRVVRDANGDKIGCVDDLMIDEHQNKLRFICVKSWDVPGLRFLIPVEAITRVSSDDVRVDRDVDQIMAAPGYEVDLVDADYITRLYDYYGYSPFWMEGSMASSLPFHY